MNRWAEISNVILGRPDNSIKNYWNSIFRHKQRELSEKLDKYLNRCMELDQPDDLNTAKKDILKRLVKHFVRQAQKQYLDHLDSKRADISFEKEEESNSKMRCFKLKLLDKALTLHHSLAKADAKAQSASSKGKSQDNVMSLKEMLASSESGEFYSVFLGSKLCEKI